MWNQNFDILTLINRIKKLGESPEEIICHPDFKRKQCFFYSDDKHSNPEDKNDYFKCSSYSMYCDQLLFYAQLRKGLGKKESYKLNAIASEEIGDEKIDYTEVGELSELPYKDYKLFVKYNIKDVLLCYKLEEKNKDVFLFYNIAQVTRTRLNKAMKKTISIKNVMQKFLFDLGLIMGNNMNVSYGFGDDKDKVTEQIEGAIVADPNLNKKIGIEIMGERSRYIHDLVIDFDLSSLYPSIIQAFNISKTTQYGRLIIRLDGPHNYKGDLTGRDLGGEVMDDLSSKDYDNIAIKHHGLKTTEQLLALLPKKKVVNG